MVQQRKRTNKKNRDKSRDYVDNKEFYRKIKEHFDDVADAEESGDDRPEIPNYIAECIMGISRNVSHMRNFINYPFREDLVADGMEEGIRRLYNFNPDKYDNPFAYFTRIIYFAMVRRIQKEKKELYVKHKMIENTVIMGTGADNYDHAEGKADMSFLDLDNDNNNTFVQDYEDSMQRKKEKKKADDARKAEVENDE